MIEESKQFLSLREAAVASTAARVDCLSADATCAIAKWWDN